eukprot:6210418-Pleurochrysis_carterae.AAC.1
MPAAVGSGGRRCLGIRACCARRRMVSGRHAPSARVSRATRWSDRLARTELMRVAQASHASGSEPS